jgi:hypothetical protein
MFSLVVLLFHFSKFDSLCYLKVYRGTGRIRRGRPLITQEIELCGSGSGGQGRREEVVMVHGPPTAGPNHFIREGTIYYPESPLKEKKKLIPTCTSAKSSYQPKHAKQTPPWPVDKILRCRKPACPASSKHSGAVEQTTYYFQ